MVEFAPIMSRIVRTQTLVRGVVAALLLVASVPASAQVAITGAPTTAPAKPKPDAVAPAADATKPSDRLGATRGGDADTMLADVAETYKYAVGVVVVVMPGKPADPIGTAWAFEPNLFATNGHVVEGMAEYLKEDPKAVFYIAINQRPDKRLRVAAYRAHPQYDKTETRFDGRTAISAFDLGVIRTTEPAPTHFKLASRSQLQALRTGSRIAYLGYPMESLAGANIDTQMPIATMQSGIVTSLSDNFLGDSGFENNRLVRHNLPSAGGASGSPIFTPDGSVVAIHWGGNSRRMLVATSDGVAKIRQGSAAQVNFAERIDGLSGVPRP
jgi:V8-like Glu-specific endopeptidase